MGRPCIDAAIAELGEPGQNGVSVDAELRDDLDLGPRVVIAATFFCKADHKSVVATSPARRWKAESTAAYDGSALIPRSPLHASPRPG